MSTILLWLLPVADVFGLRRILAYYSSLGVRVPPRHARYGLLERWVGYMPAGFVIGWFVGGWMALLIILAVLALMGPVELYLMWRGVRPWNFFRGKPRSAVTKIFLLEGYNAAGYFLLGALIGALLLG